MNFKDLVRCRTCVMPNTRPDTPFVDGECSACISHRARANVDWEARREQLASLLAVAVANGNESGYDCVVASSGGKDSHFILFTLLELGARPLIVTAKTCDQTGVGRRNVANMARFADCIEITPNLSVRRKLNRLAFRLVGDISWPEHATIFSRPLAVAAEMGIPLVFYGENPQDAYGGPPGTELARQLTLRWVSEFGGFLGMRAHDFVGQDGIRDEDMEPYLPPRPEELREAGTAAYFLGHFVPWDSRGNAELAVARGMEYHLPCTANWWAWENVDNYQTGIHDWFMFLKYGFGRGCQQISVDVRAGRIGRAEALSWVEAHDGLLPKSYMGLPLEVILSRAGITREEFNQTADAYASAEYCWRQERL